MADPITELEAECKAAGLVLEEVVLTAGVHKATWHRWKKRDFFPSFATLTKVRARLEVMRDGGSEPDAPPPGMTPQDAAA